MNILYYCVEYHCAFGPSTHGREFFAALREIPGVNQCKVIPSSEEQRSVTQTSVAHKEASRSRRLARLLTPAWLRSVVLFLNPKKSAYELIRRELASGKWDALVMRPGWALALVPGLKKEFPQICIALEINSALFDEWFKKVPFVFLWKRVEVRMINFADLIFTVSGHLKNYLTAHGADAFKVHVNPNGVNLKLFDPARFSVEDKNEVRDLFKIPGTSRLFGYVGGMQTFRRLPEMVEAFAEVAEQRKVDAVLLLIGDGADMERIQQVLARLDDGVRNKIVIAGSRPYAEIPKIMSAFDVAVFPYSNPYGSPQKLFEYMAMGLPVLGPKVPVVEETFQCGRHLLLVEQDNPDGFKQLLVRCIENPESLEAVAETGAKYVRQSFSWRANAERVVSLINRQSVSAARGLPSGRT